MMMALTETAIKNAKPGPKSIKMFDGRGLYLLLSPSGSRCWRFKYQFEGREKLISLGLYPDVPLIEARDRRERARQLVAKGIDPSAQRQAEKSAREDTFESIAREWLELQEKTLAPITLQKAKWMLEEFVFPRLGNRPITKITAPDLLAVLKRIEVRGKYETTHRTKQRCGQIFRYAIATGRAERDITADLRGALIPYKTKNFAALTDPQEVGRLLRAIDRYRGLSATAYALQLAPLTFVRPGELRHAEWTEFDLENAEWRIPAQRMKMRELHIVPLARQAVDLLRDLRAIARNSKYVFPSVRSAKRPMSENTITAALRRLGYEKYQMTAHGFRALASTLLNEQGWHPDLIELQLAHAERNKVRAAYNRAQRLSERKQMMQAWADYLDTLRAGAPVIQLVQERVA
jgi:integrase